MSEKLQLQYDCEERPPRSVSLGLGFQYVMVTIAPAILVPTIIVRHTDVGQDYLAWCIFASLLALGITTFLQGVRLGPIGSGTLMPLGAATAYIAVCHKALLSGGVGLMAAPVILSAPFSTYHSEKTVPYQANYYPGCGGHVDDAYSGYRDAHPLQSTGGSQGVLYF